MAIINNIKVINANGETNVKLNYDAVAINDSRTLKEGLVGSRNQNLEQQFLIDSNMATEITEKGGPSGSGSNVGLGNFGDGEYTFAVGQGNELEVNNSVAQGVENKTEVLAYKLGSIEPESGGVYEDSDSGDKFTIRLATMVSSDNNDNNKLPDNIISKDGTNISIVIKTGENFYKTRAKIGNISADRKSFTLLEDTSMDFIQDYYTYKDTGEIAQVLVDGGKYGSEPFIFPNNIISSHAEGYSTVARIFGHSEGIDTEAEGWAGHSEGGYTKAKGEYSHAENWFTEAIGHASHAEGGKSKSIGSKSHAEGHTTEAWGESSHIEGYSGRTYDEAMVIANKVVSKNQKTYGSNQHILEVHAKSKFALAKGDRAHVEGQQSLGLGIASHAEGLQTKAIGSYAHSEGMYSSATGFVSHAEGQGTTASGSNSHAEGRETIASGENSHAGGYKTEASAFAQTAIGKYNANNANALLIVGAGSSDNDRKNAFEVISEDGIYSLKIGNTQLTETQLNKLLSLIS